MTSLLSKQLSKSDLNGECFLYQQIEYRYLLGTNVFNNTTAKNSVTIEDVSRQTFSK